MVFFLGGGVGAGGRPHDVFTPPLLASSFGLDADVLTDPRTGLPIVVPAPSHQKEPTHAPIA